MQWFCIISGKQYGPVEESVMQQWIAEARVSASDYVWQDGMPDWKPAAEVFASSFAIQPPPLPMGLTPVGPPGGTRGRTPNEELTRQARELLAGRWGIPIAVSLLLWLISMAIQNVPFVGGIAGLVLSGPFELGGIVFFLAFTRKGPADLGMMFAGFKNFGNALAAYLLIVIFVFLWTLLLIIPGIIAALSYSMTFYILADDVRLDSWNAMKKSKLMMEGHKWRLFCLGLRFVPWALLCLLTLGIGFLWLAPYMAASFARFYDDLQAPAQPALAPTMSPA